MTNAIGNHVFQVKGNNTTRETGILSDHIAQIPAVSPGRKQSFTREQ
jgi:hypothetical protein